MRSATEAAAKLDAQMPNSMLSHTRPSGGLRVRRPRPGSAAELAGLLEGDHVVAIDGDDIETDLDAAAVQAALLASASASIRLRVLRAGEPIELSLGRT